MARVSAAFFSAACVSVMLPNFSAVSVAFSTTVRENSGGFSKLLCKERHQQQCNKQHNAYTKGSEADSIYTRRYVNGGINSSKMGSVTPTPTNEKPAAFTLTVVQKAASTAVKMAA